VQAVTSPEVTKQMNYLVDLVALKQKQVNDAKAESAQKDKSFLYLN